MATALCPQIPVWKRRRRLSCRRYWRRSIVKSRSALRYHKLCRVSSDRAIHRQNVGLTDRSSWIMTLVVHFIANSKPSGSNFTNCLILILTHTALLQVKWTNSLWIQKLSQNQQIHTVVSNSIVIACVIPHSEHATHDERLPIRHLAVVAAAAQVGRRPLPLRPR